MVNDYTISDRASFSIIVPINIEVFSRFLAMAEVYFWCICCGSILSGLIFFVLFLGRLMYDNEFETKN